MPAPESNQQTRRRIRRPKESGPSPVTTVRLRPELVEAAKALKGPRSFGWVISEALEQWVEREKSDHAGAR